MTVHGILTFADMQQHNLLCMACLSVTCSHHDCQAEATNCMQIAVESNRTVKCASQSRWTATDASAHEQTGLCKFCLISSGAIDNSKQIFVLALQISYRNGVHRHAVKSHNALALQWELVLPDKLYAGTCAASSCSLSSAQGQCSCCC